MRSFKAKTTIRLRLGHNQSIETLLKDPNLSYIMDNYEVELTRNKI